MLGVRPVQLVVAVEDAMWGVGGTWPHAPINVMKRGNALTARVMTEIRQLGRRR
jgi:hypothetical protein